MHDIRFTYKPKLALFLLSAAFFCLCALVLAYVALTNDRGLLLFHVFSLSTTEASYFYAVLALIALVFVVLGLWAVIAGRAKKMHVILAENAISAPKSGLNKTMISVPYIDIKNIILQEIYRQRFVTIIHAHGKLSIPQSMLPNKKVFDELVDLLAERHRMATINK